MDGCVPSNGLVSTEHAETDTEATMINKLHSAEEPTDNTPVDELRQSRTMSATGLHQPSSPETSKDLVVAESGLKSDSNANDLHHNNVLQQNDRNSLLHQSPQPSRHLGTAPKPSFMISDILGSVSRKRPHSPVFGLCTDNESPFSKFGRDALTSHCDDNKMDDDSRLLMSSSDCDSSDDGDSHTKGKCPTDCHALSRLHCTQLGACVFFGGASGLAVSRSASDVLSRQISPPLNDVLSRARLRYSVYSCRILFGLCKIKRFDYRRLALASNDTGTRPR